jgi:hypothetical protein
MMDYGALRSLRLSQMNPAASDKETVREIHPQKESQSEVGVINQTGLKNA